MAAFSLADAAEQLRGAVALCSARGLTNAAKWAAEQLCSIPQADRDGGAAQPDPLAARWRGHETDVTAFARTLMSASEYARAADVATADAGALGTFLRVYSQYLAAEKRKEDSRGDFAADAEVPRTTDHLLPLRNQLADLDLVRSGEPFLLYLYGVVLRKLGQVEEATTALVRSVSAYPCNWSAWLELIPCCSSSDQVAALLGRLPSHFMADFFRAQLYLDLHLWDSAAAVLDGPLAQRFANSPFVASQRAFCLYSRQHYEEAEQLYTELQEREPKRLEHMDVLSNILYVRDNAERLSQLAHHALEVDRFRPETCCIIGNYYSFKRMHHKSIEYFHRAVLLDSAFSAAWTLMGHEYLELKNAHAAIASYRRATEANPHDYRAWYGIGQAYELLQQPVFALYYYRRASVLRPYDARMWRALGSIYERLERWADAIFCYEQAHDGDGAGLLSIARLYAKMNQTAGAVRAFKQYIAMMDQAEADEDLAEACMYVAKHCVNNRDYAAASTYLARAQQAPGTSQAAAARALLRTISTALGAGAASAGHVDPQTPRQPRPRPHS